MLLGSQKELDKFMGPSELLNALAEYILPDKDAGTHLFLKTRRICHGNKSLVSNTIFPRHPLWNIGDSDFWSNPAGQENTPLSASYTESTPEHSNCVLFLRRTEVDQNWLCQFEFLIQFLLLLCLVHQHGHFVHQRSVPNPFDGGISLK